MCSFFAGTFLEHFGYVCISGCFPDVAMVRTRSFLRYKYREIQMGTHDYAFEGDKNNKMISILRQFFKMFDFNLNCIKNEVDVFGTVDPKVTLVFDESNS